MRSVNTPQPVVTVQLVAPVSHAGGGVNWTVVATLIGIALTLGGVVYTGWMTLRNQRETTRQKEASDRREAWWDRAQWALDHCCEDAASPARMVGGTVLTALSGSTIATLEDQQMLLDVATLALQPAPQFVSAAVTTPTPASASANAASASGGQN